MVDVEGELGNGSAPAAPAPAAPMDLARATRAVAAALASNAPAEEPHAFPTDLPAGTDGQDETSDDDAAPEDELPVAARLIGALGGAVRFTNRHTTADDAATADPAPAGAPVPA